MYLAGSSQDVNRCRHWHMQLVGAGVEVVSTWIDSVAAVGNANPRGATAEARTGWSRTCLEQIGDADVLWFLVPPPDRRTCGAWVELGYALGCDLRVICSGDTRQSIFTALGDEYATDADAFWAITRMITVEIGLADLGGEQ